MDSKQYTIRSVPSNVDKALRRRAKKTGRSLNEIAIEALTKGVGATPSAIFNDLDWFIGSKSLDNTFDQAIEWLNSSPKDM